MRNICFHEEIYRLMIICTFVLFRIDDGTPFSSFEIYKKLFSHLFFYLSGTY